MAATAASLVGSGLSSQLRLARSSRAGRLHRSCCPLSSLHPPWPGQGAPRLVRSSGGRPWESAVAASANAPRQQQQQQLGEHEAAAAMEPERSSPREVRAEMARCFDLVRRLGRGAVYLGSSRVPATHPHYLQAAELAREIASLLDCTTWSGAGPGLMDAATQGALEAGKPVGGFKIGKEAGEWTTSNFHPYLPSESYLTCRFFSARKHGLVDAAMRNCPTDRTAVIALPGGIGTMDELFEMMTLIQLERIGSTLPVPFLLLNYDSYYSKLLEFLNDCEEWGTVAPGEVASLWKVCNGNHEALEYLAHFYNVPVAERNYCVSPRLNQQRTSHTAS
ncbi:probable cytokinin riboside 5'-monophosphate phosphoribohydrolase LOGL5 [Oryza brachyantha]|uniref:Uncharacterized protein n=1 Tax=Oryza brachyantha TaxID=4533 RepID=J3LQJ3_ORYBR|nr:probable cytokinin riboside 5'-monophosphate phosphoribohydrolase LOGL5 [Oryza brachyantha]